MPPFCPALIAANFPALCRTIDVYCERTSEALDAEPLNAVSGLAMLVVALAAARLMRARPNHVAAGSIWSAVAALAVGAVGAALFHTTAAVWAVWVDMLPFLVFMLIVLWLTLTRFLEWAKPAAGVAVAAFLALTFGAGPFVRGLLPFGLYYVTPLLVLAAVAAVLVARQSPAARSYAAATLTFLAAIVARELDAPLCDAFPAGTHFLWHLFTALLAWLLLRAAILYAPPRKGRGSPLPKGEGFEP